MQTNEKLDNFPPSPRVFFLLNSSVFLARIYSSARNIGVKPTFTNKQREKTECLSDGFWLKNSWFNLCRFVWRAQSEEKRKENEEEEETFDEISSNLND